MEREIWLPARPESAPVARALVRKAASERGIDGDDVWAVMLATTEALANAIEHGGACARRGGAILLRIESRGDGICVEVRDCGEFRVPPARADGDAIRGRGIPLIAALVDRLELLPDPEQTRVRLIKRARAA
jgi:serine/threonine-protein kinase RsbW